MVGTEHSWKIYSEGHCWAMGGTVAPIRRKVTGCSAACARTVSCWAYSPILFPWNTPIFVVKKKSGRLTNVWKLRDHYSQDCQDLWLSLRIITWWWLTSRTAFLPFLCILRTYPNLLLAFPLNFREPHQRYYWVVLPQGAANSPTLCQECVSRALQPPREQHHSYVIHYMDAILIAASKECDLHAGLQTLYEGLKRCGFVVPEKMLTMFPFQYLGHQLL